MPPEPRLPPPSWTREAIACGNALHFRKQRPAVHNLINLTTAAALLGGIAALVAAAPRCSPWLYVPVAGALIGICFFGLFIVVIHEASHNMFLLSRSSRRSRLWNRLSGWCIAIPFSTHYHHHWELGHPVHHQIPVEREDPQQDHTLTGRPLLRRVAAMLLLPGYVFLWNPSRKYPGSRWIALASLLFWAALTAATAHFLIWYAPLAFLVGFQVIGTLNQLKGALEHGGAVGSEPELLLRSRTSLFPGRRLLMPFNISLHFEHHLNCNVPWYLLPRYQAQLRQIVPQPLQPYVFNTQCWQQLTGRFAGIPPRGAL